MFFTKIFLVLVISKANCFQMFRQTSFLLILKDSIQPNQAEFAKEETNFPIYAFFREMKSLRYKQRT